MKTYVYNVTSGPSRHVLAVDGDSEEEAHVKVVAISSKHDRIVIVLDHIEEGDLNEYLGREACERITDRMKSTPKRVWNRAKPIAKRSET